MFNIIKHLIIPDWWTKRAFGGGVLKRIEAAIAKSEKQHRGELRFAVEGGFDPHALLKRITPRERAIEVFSQLRVWDTVENGGVLIYVQLIDRDIEIVADRGISACVSQDEWNAICARMETAFREGRFEAGALTGIDEVTALLARHFPACTADTNELPDKPVVL
jgi:uncharacterized membrane protein